MGNSRKVRIAIIGSGKIGTDLLLKILRSELLECVLFVGRSEQSLGISKARSLGVRVSCESVSAIVAAAEGIDLVVDATSAGQHLIHAPIFERLGLKVIDLTPAKLGPFCVPSINPNCIFEHSNINMVTCGGQSSIPLIHCLFEAGIKLTDICIESYLAKDSVGPGTIANIDEYYTTTASAIREYTGVESVDVKLSLEESTWQPNMLTVIRLTYTKGLRVDIFAALKERLARVQQYVPGYNIVGTPFIRKGQIEITVSVSGIGDWLPVHAGNLDIINCAAISVAERYATYAKLSVDECESLVAEA